MSETELDVLIEDDRWTGLGLEPLAERAVLATLARLDLSEPVELSVLAADDARIAALNADFRDKPTPTNVLSWPAQTLVPSRPGGTPPPPDPDPLGEPLFLGDIALAWETCSAEAAAAGKTLADHATHLIVHAVLHLLGYDHETEPDADLMEGLEVEILAYLGLPSPY